MDINKLNWVLVVGNATVPSGIELQDLVRTAHPTFNFVHLNNLISLA
ncbi:MAG TPA: hypothetical protein V6D14_07960 [Coleofasciculaceae cyanobacterium]